MSWQILTSALMTVALVSSQGVACKGKNVVFEEDFIAPNPAWSQNLMIDSGTARITAEKNGLRIELYRGATFANTAICVDVILPEAEDPSQTWGGLVFWSGDISDYYLFSLSADGWVDVTQERDGKKSTAVEEREVDGIDAVPGSKHTLEVRLDGTNASLFVDDIPVANFKGDPLVGKNFIGLASDSGKDEQITWVFSHLRVTNLP
jgi:hypothetical protein